MLLVLLGTTFFAASVFSYGCDVVLSPEQQRELGSRVCNLENEIDVLKAAVQELLQRSDLTLNNEFVPAMEKRKNEFIRFGKRSSNIVKRKNEFIRFGKRKNEFIRFGRFDPSLRDDNAVVEKRKNEFIRFG